LCSTELAGHNTLFHIITYIFRRYILYIQCVLYTMCTMYNMYYVQCVLYTMCTIYNVYYVHIINLHIKFDIPLPDRRISSS
jgi:hypothetical protein